MRRRADRDDISVGHQALSMDLAPRLRQLIQNVLDRHAAAERYAPDLLPQAVRHFGDDLHVLVAKRSGEPVGCAVMLRSGDELLAKWIGLDYRRTWDTATYHLLLVESIALAIQLGVARLRLGATAIGTKRQFGVLNEERLTAIALPAPVRWLVDVARAA
jgi:predicted N-acyltransferase